MISSRSRSFGSDRHSSQGKIIPKFIFEGVLMFVTEKVEMSRKLIRPRTSTIQETGYLSFKPSTAYFKAHELAK